MAERTRSKDKNGSHIAAISEKSVSTAADGSLQQIDDNVVNDKSSRSHASKGSYNSIPRKGKLGQIIDSIKVEVQHFKEAAAQHRSFQHGSVLEMVG